MKLKKQSILNAEKYIRLNMVRRKPRIKIKKEPVKPAITCKEGLEWIKFIESERGCLCKDIKTLTTQEYLENRLWWAFNIGFHAASKQ